jgi:hypothetical protein
MVTEQQLDEYLTGLMNKKLDEQATDIQKLLGGNLIEVYRDLDNHLLYYIGVRNHAVTYKYLGWDNQLAKNTKPKLYVEFYVYDFWRKRTKLSGRLPDSLRYENVLLDEYLDVLYRNMHRVFELDWTKK